MYRLIKHECRRETLALWTAAVMGKVGTADLSTATWITLKDAESFNNKQRITKPSR